jgi:hypothetical protein
LSDTDPIEAPDVPTRLKQYLDDLKKPMIAKEQLGPHRDLRWNYSFWRPLSWRRYDMQEQYGFIYAPGPDPRTGFYVSVQDLSDQLEESVQKEDLPALRDGVLAGLERLPECEVLYDKETFLRPAVGLEVMLTFSVGDDTCKRHMRLLYRDRTQFTLYGQGVPVEQFDLYDGFFRFMYTTFAFRDMIANAGHILLPPEYAPVEWQGGEQEHPAGAGRLVNN